MRRPLLALLLLALAARSSGSAAAPGEAPAAAPALAAAPAPAAPRGPAPPEEFRPSARVPADQAVSFPVDI